MEKKKLKKSGVRWKEWATIIFVVVALGFLGDICEGFSADKELTTAELYSESLAHLPTFVAIHKGKEVWGNEEGGAWGRLLSNSLETLN
jgi:hypothetical protein